MHRRTRGGPAVLLTLALLAGAASCTSGGHSGHSAATDPPRVSAAALRAARTSLRGAVRHTGDLHSARVETTSSSGAQLTTRSSGTVDWGHGRVTGTVVLTVPTGSASTAGSGSAALPSRTTTRYLPGAMYVDLGTAVAKETAGRRWVKYDYRTFSKLTGVAEETMLIQMRNENPVTSLQLLMASGDLRRTGTATVRGVHTVRYASDVDVAALTARQAGLTAKKAKKLRAGLKSAGITTERVTVWVGDRGAEKNLLVKCVGRGSMTSGTFTGTTYYSHYGVKVRVKAPPARETVDFTSLMREEMASPSPGGS
jgi:hypothetical protein